MANNVFRDTFDREIRSVFSLVNKVLSLQLKNKPNDANAKLYLKSKKAYCLIFSTSQLDTHKRLIRDIFDIQADEILTEEMQDDWLRNGEIVLHYGKGIAGVKQNKRLYVSEVYKLAVDMREERLKSLVGMPPSSYEKHQEINWPEALQLHMYSLFREVTEDPADREQLGKYIASLQTTLGINPTPASSDQMNNFMSQLAGGVGVNGNGMMEQVNNLFGQFSQNPEAAEVIGQIKPAFEQIVNAKSKEEAGQAFQGLINSNPMLSNLAQQFGPMMSQLGAMAGATATSAAAAAAQPPGTIEDKQ